MKKRTIGTRMRFFVLLIMLESKETLRIACPRLVKTDLPRTILEPA